VDGFTSRVIALAGSNTGSLVIDGNGGETTAKGLFLIANSDSDAGNVVTVDKDYIGSGSPSTSSGFKSIRITVFGENESGDDFELTVNTGASFGDFDNCEE
jgi:hypothetical protein